MRLSITALTLLTLLGGCANQPAQPDPWAGLNNYQDPDKQISYLDSIPVRDTQDAIRRDSALTLLTLRHQPTRTAERTLALHQQVQHTALHNVPDEVQAMAYLGAQLAGLPTDQVDRVATQRVKQQVDNTCGSWQLADFPRQTLQADELRKVRFDRDMKLACHAYVSGDNDKVMIYLYDAFNLADGDQGLFSKLLEADVEASPRMVERYFEQSLAASGIHLSRLLPGQP